MCTNESLRAGAGCGVPFTSYLISNVTYRHTCQRDADTFYIGETGCHIGVRGDLCRFLPGGSDILYEKFGRGSEILRSRETKILAPVWFIIPFVSIFVPRILQTLHVWHTIPFRTFPGILSANGISNKIWKFVDACRYGRGYLTQCHTILTNQKNYFFTALQFSKVFHYI